MNYYDFNVNTIRILSAEMITKAKSGHPGICLGAAPIMHTLFTKFLNITNVNDMWFNRDRFVLSAGHGSALLYTMLHLAGFGLTIDDLKQFRQKGSLTPGHPEYKHTKGVEMTTGPLGQGISTAVGMAIAEKYQSRLFNKEDLKLIDHYTYVLCGDGDLQEGISMEAASLAGHLGLGKLIVLFDSNDIQLDGPTNLAVSDNIKKKFESMGWEYLIVQDGNDLSALERTIKKAKRQVNKPTLIEIKTVIGFGAPNYGTSSVHGKPLSATDLEVLRNNLGYSEPEFTVNTSVYEYYKKNCISRGKKAYNHWNKMLADYQEKYPQEYETFMHFVNDDFDLDLSNYVIPEVSSTRKVMGQINKLAGESILNMIGGSADLVSSTMIQGNDGNFTSEHNGRNINFGVREHAMGAVVNGLTLSNMKGLGAGFFVFSDYLKPAIRLAAIMQIPSLFLFSHDSVCVGEDGPTHQPIEQLAGLRAIPNLNVVRPADAKEMLYAYKEALKKNAYPTVIVSTRQDIKTLSETNEEGFVKGAYIAYEPQGEVSRIIISCGSELGLAIQTAKELEKNGVNTRVVSMPSMYIFEQQTKEYKEQVLPSNITKRIAVEMGASMPWFRYANEVLGIDTFGQSMPLALIAETYGFTVENLKQKVLAL